MLGKHETKEWPLAGLGCSGFGWSDRRSLEHRLRLTAIVTVTASGINLVKEPIRNAGLMPDYRSGIVTGVGAEGAPPGSVVSCSRGPYVV